MTWEEFNQSRTGKVTTVLVVIVVTLAAWVLFSRYQADREAKSPLPGGAAGDPCTIWFVGSSTMRRWDNLADDMAPWKAVSRGVDGATFAQITRRFSLDPAKIGPRAIVLYAGENELASGVPVEQAILELRRFLAVKERMFPAVPTILISLKPSPARWADRPQQLLYNDAAKQIAAGSGEVTYIEIGQLLMDGNHPGDHYVADGVHLTPDGYRRWTPTLKAALKERLGTPHCT